MVKAQQSNRNTHTNKRTRNTHKYTNTQISKYTRAQIHHPQAHKHTDWCYQRMNMVIPEQQGNINLEPHKQTNTQRNKYTTTETHKFTTTNTQIRHDTSTQTHRLVLYFQNGCGHTGAAHTNMPPHTSTQIGGYIFYEW